ncbi:MAG TPA: aminoacyl-tRNA hydrolase [Dehalococcoidia bacterium]|nr:aminoacyl-tRNA hydrolase [Dehalococcoidia bacterium]
MKLIVGLGNPGRRYAGNRHNVGFICLSHFARNHAMKFDRKLGRARTGQGEVAHHKVILARPQTHMNQSGQSVALLVNRFAVTLDNLLVIHDDLDLAPGKFRISYGVGSGGHKGIDSIISYLNCQDFIRLRVGIGHPRTANNDTTEAAIIDYVLGDFTPDEKKIMAGVIPVVSEAILCLITQGLSAAMNKYN